MNKNYQQTPVKKGTRNRSPRFPNSPMQDSMMVVDQGTDNHTNSSSSLHMTSRNSFMSKLAGVRPKTQGHGTKV